MRKGEVMKYFLLIPAVLTFLTSVCLAEERKELDEVVVTASRVEEKKKETPSTVDIVSAKEMEKIKYRNAAEVLQRIPGVDSHNFGGEEELTSIRVPTTFGNPYVLLLVDGLPTTSYGKGGGGLIREINSGNIERIEVVKGPASAIYGSNAIGGVINVITKRPSAEPQVKAWTEYGEYDQYRSGISASGTSEKLSYNVDLNTINSTGWREHSENKKQAADLKLQYVPTDTSLLTFKYDFVKLDNDLSGSISEAKYLADWRQSDNTFTNVKMDKHSLALTYLLEIGAGELSTSLIYRNLDHEVNPNYGIRFKAGKYTSTLSKILGNDIDLQLLYSRGFALLNSKLVGGIDFAKGDTKTDIYTLAVAYDNLSKKYTSFTVTGLGESYAMTTDVVAPYIQAEAFIIDKLKLQVGGRYDTARYDVEDQLGKGFGGKQNFSRFSPKIGATYDCNSNLNVYGNYSQGFVIPTTTQLFTTSSKNPNLSPEKADNFEVGMRSSFWDKLVSFDLALYHMTIKDKIITRTVDPVTKASEYTNASETSQKGVEATTVISPYDWLRLTLAYTYAENKYEDYRDPLTGKDYSGKWMPRSSQNMLNARLSVLPLTGLEVELEMDEVGKQYADDANIYSDTRPTLFHLRGVYDWNNWSFWTQLQNLADKKYSTYVNASYGSMTYYPGAPRTFFAGLSYKWGK